jgi:trigger factor
METQVSEISPVEVQVTVEIPWDRVRQDLDTQFKKLGQQARVKGFRPGKVPPKVLRQLFGRQVRGEVTAALVEQGLLHAVQKHELQIVSQPQVDAPSLEEGKPLTFTAKMEVRPTVDSVDVTQLELAQPSKEVETAQIDEEVERLRTEHAEVRVPEPMRPAGAGDILTIDYTVSIDGVPNPEMGATDRPVELGRDKLIPEFEKGLEGLIPGEQKAIAVAFEDDHGREDLRGKTATFDVQVKELRETILPEVDDEFAKDVGDYETLLELRLKIREQLEKLAERRAEAELKDQLIDKLVETNDVPVPPSMVREEQMRMLYEFAAFMQMGGQEPPPMSDELRTKMHERAERKVKAAILLSSLARQQGIEIGPGDVDRKIQEIAESSGKHVAKVKAEYTGERREGLESQLLEEKLMDYLMGQAKIVEPGEAPEPRAEAAPAKKKKAPATKKAAPKKRTKKKAESEEKASE